ncbi:MAG: MoxR family ATPase [Defluviitaleaceae bacterium]|nr:MoxR family ATPase [Defluviitaleaceae bacterium]MCL2261967.1 MoxR family ATPase [Defluviitaleaceae bacterium]
MLKDLADRIKGQINSYVLNQEAMTELALVALFAGGHVLLEGVPGLAKTLWARSLARTVGVDCKRVQFTADLMPSDILGTKIFNQQTGAFELRRGPLFTQLLLADEINRTPPKTQSALLEVMEERAITIDGETHTLSEPFFVMATQNPVEYEGTYPLPEALTDRFMMKILLTYPGVAAEKQLLQMYHQGFDAAKLAETNMQPVAYAHDILEARREIQAVTVEEGLFNYIVSVVETTRRMGAVQYGASPRGSVALLLAAKTYAAMQGRDFVIPDDVRFLSAPVLRHRIMLNPESEIEGTTTDGVIETILEQVKAPR